MLEAQVAALLVSRGIPAQVRGSDVASWIVVDTLGTEEGEPGSVRSSLLFARNIQDEQWHSLYVDPDGRMIGHTLAVTNDSPPEDVVAYIIDNIDFDFDTL